jgi:hypothetical protein
MPALDARPEVSDHLGFVWSAFWELGSDRAIGFAAGPIPFTAIDAYAARYGIDDIDQFDRFRALIRAMECERADYQEERRKANEKAGG